MQELELPFQAGRLLTGIGDDDQACLIDLISFGCKVFIRLFISTMKFCVRVSYVVVFGIFSGTKARPVRAPR